MYEPVRRPVGNVPLDILLASVVSVVALVASPDISAAATCSQVGALAALPVPCSCRYFLVVVVFPVSLAKVSVAEE